MKPTACTTFEPTTKDQTKNGRSIRFFLRPNLDPSQIVKIWERFPLLPATVGAHLADAYPFDTL